MKNLKISFKGNTSLVYVSMFKENIIDKINSVDPRQNDYWDEWLVDFGINS